ncbi:MAG: hypothetical protein AB1432_15955 [Bacteroidota bacterium]
MKLLKKNCLLIVFIILIFSNCNSIINEDVDEIDKKNLMIVYPNSGRTIYLIDNQTFEIKKTIIVGISDKFDINRMCLSTNKDYFVFSLSLKEPPFSHSIASYNIREGRIENFFSTGLDSIGAPRITAAEITNKPGLVYFYSHLNGLFSFNFITKEIIQIPYDYNFDVGVQFIKSPDSKWIVLDRGLPSTHELEFYKTDIGLQNLQFVLNKNDIDSISIYDIAFSENNESIFLTYQLSKNRGRYMASYFGNYNLETKQLYKSLLKFPWSLNPYYMAYSPKRNEAYLVGAYDTLYIIDVKKYSIKNKITLTGKVNGPSKLLIRPDDKVLFISCFDSDFVFAIDLESRAILRKINLPFPYLLLEL